MVDSPEVQLIDKLANMKKMFEEFEVWKTQAIVEQLDQFAISLGEYMTGIVKRFQPVQESVASPPPNSEICVDCGEKHGVETALHARLVALKDFIKSASEGKAMEINIPQDKIVIMNYARYNQLIQLKI